MSKHNTDSSDQHAAKRRWLNAHEEGYHKAMGNRQVQMIAIGGAIGTGLFLGAGARLQMAGPALALVYLICGLFSFFILRALGELVLHRPSSGSFVSYAREFLGEKAAYVAGWMYFINWAMTGIVDITAVALYMHYWGASHPQALLFATFGVMLGIVIGALPGLTATMGVAILLPFTYGMEPVSGLLMICGVFFGGVYGGSITAILLKIPGFS